MVFVTFILIYFRRVDIRAAKINKVSVKEVWRIVIVRDITIRPLHVALVGRFQANGA